MYLICSPQPWSLCNPPHEHAMPLQQVDLDIAMAARSKQTTTKKGLPGLPADHGMADAAVMGAHPRIPLLLHLRSMARQVAASLPH